ncbi:helix-turn-helix domain-containing protein [Natronococcus roseus]|uniref:helix-turn-helix domain-containing protein n=1 Tax=Natronococcus roseus TaxID=1052014 RepID=UPI00374DF8DB
MNERTDTDDTLDSPREIVLPTPEDIRSLRHDLGLSRRELAETAGVHINTVEGVEMGETDPTLPTLARIVEGLIVAEARARHEEQAAERTADA